MKVRVGRAGFWRGVTVLFAQDARQDICRVLVNDEGLYVHDILPVGPNRCLVLLDDFVQGKRVTKLEQWDFSAGTRRVSFVPEGLIWERFAVSPDHTRFAITGGAPRKPNCVVSGMWNGPTSVTQLNVTGSHQMHVWDVRDDGFALIWEWDVGQSGNADMHLLLKVATQTQWIGQFDPAVFPTLNDRPHMTPDTGQRRADALALMIPEKGLPASAQAARMPTRWPVAMTLVDVPAQHQNVRLAKQP